MPHFVQNKYLTKVFHSEVNSKTGNYRIIGSLFVSSYGPSQSLNTKMPKELQ